MIAESQRVSQEDYDLFLQTLKNLKDANKLSDSKLVSSQLVLNHIARNPALSPHESLRNLLTEFLEQLEEWSPILGGILRARFWEQRTVDEMSTLGIPREYAPRTILDKQRQGIYQLATWFIEREKRVSQNKLSEKPVRGTIPTAIRNYLGEFPQFDVPHNIAAEFVTTSRDSFFAALRHVMASLGRGDNVFATDSLNIEKSFILYWVTEGLEYLKINHATALRGVKITRAFIINRADKIHHSEFLEKLLLLQCRSGILPIVVDVESLPPDYLREFIYIEDKFVDEVIYDFRSIEVIDNYIHWSLHKLALFKERSNFIKGFADPAWHNDLPMFETFEQVAELANNLRADFFNYAEKIA